MWRWLWTQFRPPQLERKRTFTGDLLWEHTTGGTLWGGECCWGIRLLQGLKGSTCVPTESTKTPFDAVSRSVADSVSVPRRLYDAHTESPRDRGHCQDVFRQSCSSTVQSNMCESTKYDVALTVPLLLRRSYSNTTPPAPPRFWFSLQYPFPTTTLILYSVSDLSVQECSLCASNHLWLIRELVPTSAPSDWKSAASTDTRVVAVWEWDHDLKSIHCAALINTACTVRQRANRLA